MKAYTGKTGSIRSVKGKGPYRGHPIRLTVGLIVKNEEKTLDRCLSSLAPLLEAVESELIVTDTGSTDRTAEIAEQYADRVLRFEWCGDFSAARNTGLAAARGEWFLFLDGDEWFEDVSGLIEFFTSGECDKYGSAAYIQRNYGDFDGKTHTDFHALRVFRMYPGIHFSNIVHESIARMTPTKFLDDYVHHYGYVYRDEREKMEKFNRNTELLERELEENPADLKAYYQLGKQYFVTKDYDKIVALCERGLQTEPGHPSRIWRLSILHNLVLALFSAGKYEEVLEKTEELFRSDPHTEIGWLDFRYCAQAAAFRLKQYGRSVSHGEEYLKVYGDYRADRLDRDMLLFCDYFYLEPLHREQAVRLLGWAFYRLDDMDGTARAVSELEPAGPDCLRPDLSLISALCARTGEWARLAAYYRRAAASGGIEESRLQNETELFLPLTPEPRAAAVRALAALPDGEDPYVRLNRLRAAEQEGGGDAAAREFEWFARWNGVWGPLFSDVLYWRMKEKLDPSPYLRKIDADGLKFQIAEMRKRHPDWIETVRSCGGIAPRDTPKELFWSLCLREKVLLCEKDWQRDEEISYFLEYAGRSARFVRLLYRDECLADPERLAVLPRAHRFGYWIGEALAAKKRADGAEYLKYLRLALASYPPMEHPISALLERDEKEKELGRKKAAEFAKLARKVKERIGALIAAGNLEEAGRVTAQLAALLPDDPDVVRFRRLTHTEPDMQELASRLPQ